VHLPDKIVPLKEGKMKTYTFRVVVEPSEDRWFAYCPILESRGAATWGYTKEEALKNIQEVVQMVIESMVKYDESIPEEPEGEVKVTVTYHKSSDTFDFKTLRSMIEVQAHWTEDDLRRLKLIK